MEIRKLAQEYAVKPEHNIPMSWADHECERKLFESSSTTIINKTPSYWETSMLTTHRGIQVLQIREAQSTTTYCYQRL